MQHRGTARARPRPDRRSSSLVEVVVALVTGSLALLADAGHMLSDSFGLVMALAAITVAQRAGSPARRTFGYHRTEILAAGAQRAGPARPVRLDRGAARSGRLGDAPELDGRLILAAGARRTGRRTSSACWCCAPARKESLNVRGAYLEVLGDALGSVAVIVSAAVILLTGWYDADPIASLVIAALIVPRALVAAARGRRGAARVDAPATSTSTSCATHILGVPGRAWTCTTSTSGRSPPACRS